MTGLFPRTEHHYLVWSRPRSCGDRLGVDFPACIPQTPTNILFSAEQRSHASFSTAASTVVTITAAPHLNPNILCEKFHSELGTSTTPPSLTLHLSPLLWLQHLRFIYHASDLPSRNLTPHAPTNSKILSPQAHTPP